MKTSEAKANLAKKLKSARVSKHVTKQKLATHLRVPTSTITELESIAEGEMSAVSLQGMSKRYAKYVDLPVNEIAAELDALSPTPASKTKRKHKTKSSRVFVASRVTYALIASVVLTIVLSYALWQAWQLAAAPKLDLHTPVESNIVVDSPVIDVVGQSSPDASVLVNGDNVSMDNNGNFKTTVYVQEGQNFIQVQALNSFGREAKETIRVIFNP